MPDFVDSSARLTKLIARFEPQLQQTFITLMNQVKSAATLDVVAELIRTGRVNEALGAMQSAANAFFATFSSGFVIAATETGVLLAQGLDEIITFNPIGDAATRTLRADRLRITRGITETQRRATSEALIQGTRDGVNPKEQARRFRDSIGLTDGQVRAVNNYRRLLEGGSAEALQRNLRDTRFDRTVERAIRTGIPPSPAQIDRMVERYGARMLDFRARTIAQTEALRGVHEGVDAMYAQAILDGDLQENELERTWFTASDERVRGSHKSMNGQQRGARVPFTSGAGASLMHPGDPNASAAETVRCRCALTTRISTA